MTTSSLQSPPRQPGAPGAGSTASAARTIVLVVTVDDRQLDDIGIDAQQLMSQLHDAVLSLAPGATAIIAESADAGARMPSRAGADPDPEVIVAPMGGGQLVMDLRGRRTWLDDKEIALTYVEFELLAYLAANPGRAVSRAELLHQVWGHPTINSRDRTVDVHVRRLRSKLGDYAEYLSTVRRIGYRFERRGPAED